MRQASADVDGHADTSAAPKETPARSTYELRYFNIEKEEGDGDDDGDADDDEE